MPVPKPGAPATARPAPRTSRSTKVRMVVSQNDVVIYGNQAAFNDLAAWMTYLAASPPSEHCEMHLPWHLQSHFSKLPRISVIDRATGRPRTRPFELTFMIVENADLPSPSGAATHRAARSTRGERQR